jgi:hypothetical protein
VHDAPTSATARTTLPALAANAAERHALELDAVLRTSVASMPSRVPSQNTRHPRAIELRRDGEARKHVPPVPPR